MRELFLNKFRVLTYVLFLLIPFIYFDSTIDPVLYPRQMVVSIWTLLMFCLLFVTKNEGKSKSLPVSACLFAVFFVFSACFVFFSSNLSESVAVVSRYASFVALFMVLYLLLKRNLIQYKDLFISVSLFHLAILIMLCWDIATQIETQV
ncbi:MAG: hypothetical protein MRY83_03590, partial [Flavobacteriales bacterium]|nr:hypothetical protein [Flavobacteriales bacterium]